MAQSIKNVIFNKSFTRPSDTTTYAAEDSVNATGGVVTPQTFSVEDGVLVNLGSSYLIKTARLVTNSTTTTNASFRLYLYDTVPTAYVDNSPQPLVWADKDKRCGYIDFTLATGGSGSDSAEATVTDVNIAIRMQGTTFYGILVAKAAYIPASAQQFYLEVIAHQIDQ